MPTELTDKSIVAIITDSDGNKYLSDSAPVYKRNSRVRFHGYLAGCNPVARRWFEVEYRVVEEVRP